MLRERYLPKKMVACWCISVTRKIFAKEDICLLVPELLRCETLLKSALRARYFEFCSKWFLKKERHVESKDNCRRRYLLASASV
jgi:hypothetical protein